MVGAGYKQNARLDTGQMWLQRDCHSRQRPPCEQRCGDWTRLEEEGTLEREEGVGALARPDCEGVGGVALLYGFGLGNESPWNRWPDPSLAEE